jgi:hypothetical protein
MGEAQKGDLRLGSRERGSQLAIFAPKNSGVTRVSIYFYL